jgi:hypothetical protein
MVETRQDVATMQKAGEKDAVLEETQQEVVRIGGADVVLGILTHNNRDTITRAVQASLDAVGNSLTGQRVVLIHADGNSRDGTGEHLREMVSDRVPVLQVRYPLHPVERVSAPIAGVPGRREAALVIFQYARQLGAKACALLDTQLESITAEWVHRLAQPVLDGAADLIVPVYRRRKFDGLINSGILSPFARALFGKRLRQPVGADLAFSAPLMDFFVEEAGSHPHKRASLDPWSTVPAITNGFRVGQTCLGPREVRSQEAPLDLSGTLRLVIGSLFEHMESMAAFWQKVRGSEVAPWFGPPLEIEEETSEINRKPMIESFRQGCQDLDEIWRFVLPPATLLELRRIVRQPEAQFRFADELWARVIYDFALGYHLRVIGRDHLLAAITPLYLGWAASFTGEMQAAGGMEVENRLERLSVHFEAQKRYLISRWRWPDQFNP